MSPYSVQNAEGGVPHRRNSRRLTRVVRGAARILAPALIATVMATGLAVPATAAETVEFSTSPDIGPTTGGTTVAVTWTPPAALEFESVAAGWDHSLAIATNGKTYAWGKNEHGQLGDGGSNMREVRAVEVALPVGVTLTSISAGFSHSLGIASNGKTYAWGDNQYGQLGDGGIGGHEVSPVEVQLPAGVTFTSISAGQMHSMAMGSDNRLYAWGNDAWGQLGNGDPLAHVGAPVAVSHPSGVTFTSFSAGATHSLAVGSDRNTYAWGSNTSGQLGDGSTTDSSTPIAVTPPSGVTLTEVSAGNFYSGAISSDGEVYLWGDNTHGQLGDASNMDFRSPAPAVLPDDPEIERLSVGQYHVLAISASGVVYAWGYNTFAQLGDGTAESKNIPVTVLLPSGVTFDEVSAKGRYHSMAVGSDGNAYTWGGNTEGQLGHYLIGASWPTPVDAPVLHVTGVLFDGVEGTGLTRFGSGYRVVTPAHAEGAVDVTIQWSFAGVTREPQTLTNAYTYFDPAVAPDAPLDVSGTAGDGDVLLSWFAPGDDGGSPVTDYEIEYSSDGGVTWTSFDDGFSDSLEVNVTGLTNGTDYAFRVRALNGVGAGPWSAASEPLTPVAAPVEGGSDDPADADATDGLADEDTTDELADTVSAPSPVDPDPAPNLSATGAELVHVFVLGGALLAAGCAILLARLRRRA